MILDVRESLFYSSMSSYSLLRSAIPLSYLSSSSLSSPKSSQLSKYYIFYFGSSLECSTLSRTIGAAERGDFSTCCSNTSTLFSSLFKGENRFRSLIFTTESLFFLSFLALLDLLSLTKLNWVWLSDSWFVWVSG